MRIKLIDPTEEYGNSPYLVVFDKVGRENPELMESVINCGQAIKENSNGRCHGAVASSDEIEME